MYNNMSSMSDLIVSKPNKFIKLEEDKYLVLLTELILLIFIYYYFYAYTNKNEELVKWTDNRTTQRNTR